MRSFVGQLPYRIAALKRDKRGFPIPAFVAPYGDGEPKFEIVSGDHFKRCVKQDRCWICGAALNRMKTFVVGPMCCINRISPEPPSHYECAEFAALNCPFLSKPLAKRVPLPGEITPPAGIMIERNPGVAALWLTKTY